MDDISTLAEHNTRFIQACRQGSWEVLEPLLTRSCSYLDGVTGKASDMERYVRDLKENQAVSLSIDQVVIHVDGDTAVVSARSRPCPGQADRYLLAYRYLQTYQRRGDDWLCLHACVWPLLGC